MIYWWVPFLILQVISIIIMWSALITLQRTERRYKSHEFVFYFIFMIIWELMWGFYELRSYIRRRKTNETI